MAGPVGHFRAGKNSRVMVSGTALKKSTWDLTLRGDDLDTNTFESGGIEQGTIGIVGVDFSYGANWDAQVNNLDNPPGLYPRDDGPDHRFFTNVTDAVFWDLPQVRILSAKNGAEVKGLVTFATEGKQNGTSGAGTSLVGVTTPTGSV